MADLFLDGRVTVHAGDCMDVLAGLPENSVDSVCCDPPYHLTAHKMTTPQPAQEGYDDGRGNPFCRPQARAGFMGKVWDGGDIAFQPATWAAVMRVLKPGGHMVAFGGTRTFHRLACAIEDGGFEIRDAIMWHYGQGFAKSHDISKALDRAAGAEREIVGVAGRSGSLRSCMAGDFTGGEYMSTAPATDAARQWQGWGSALKPATEILCLARKPLSEKSIAANVLKWGTGAINIDGCRVGMSDTDLATTRRDGQYGETNAGDVGFTKTAMRTPINEIGRWPANIILDGSDEVLAGFPETSSGLLATHHSRGTKTEAVYGTYRHNEESQDFGGDSGSAARFFYTAKADSEDRLGSKHPTVKPLDLMQYLCRLITPPGGTVLDMFAGTGTTAEAAWREGFRAILIEREAEYLADIARRMELAVHPTKRAAVAKTKNNLMGAEGTPLFSQEAAE